jgi:hypothetical protein
MPRRPPNLRANQHVETFKRRTVTRPIVRLFAVRPSALREVSIDVDGSGVQLGERLVLAIDADDVAGLDLAELTEALKAVIKQQRKRLGARPNDDAWKVYSLKQQGLSTGQIVERLGRKGASHGTNQERRVQRLVADVVAYLARAEERGQRILTPRQRAILKAAETVALRSKASQL